MIRPSAPIKCGGSIHSQVTQFLFFPANCVVSDTIAGLCIREAFEEMDITSIAF